MFLKTAFNSAITVVLLAACSGPVRDSGIQQPRVTIDESLMDRPLACLQQAVWDRNEPPFDRRVLETLVVRVGAIPDLSGKTSQAGPSENPRELRSYMQETIAQSGMFALLSIDGGVARGGDQSTPPGGSGFAVDDQRANILIQGRLDGDTDLSSDNAELQLSVGPISLITATRRRLVAQRLYVELIDNASGQVLSLPVSDPYLGGIRRMKMGASATVVLPDTGADFGATGDGAFSGTDVSAALGAGFRVNLNRPQALELAVKTIWFELLRRVTNSYAMSERCLTPGARAYIDFPRRLHGLVVSVDPTAAEPPGGPRRRAVQKPSGETAPRASRQRAESAPARPAPPRSEAASGVAASANANRWSVSFETIDPGIGGAAAHGAFSRRLAPGLRRAFGRGSDIGLFNAASRVLESASLGVVNLSARGAQAQFAAGPIEKSGGVYCRRLSIASAGGATTMRACRDRLRPIWRFDAPA